MLGTSGLRLGAGSADAAPSAWAAHQEGAALLILCAIAYVASTWPWRRPAPAGVALAVLAEGGATARAELHARLRVALVCAVGCVIVSGEFSPSLLLPERLGQMVVGLHILAGAAVFLLSGALALVGGGAPSAEARDAQPSPRATSVPAVAHSRPHPIRIGMYLGGCLSFSLGVKLFIDSGLGTDPLTSMALGVSGWLHLAGVRIGAVTGAATLAMLALWCRWARLPPPPSTFLTMAGVGYLIDGWNALGLEAWTGWALSPVGRMLAGLFLDAYGSALIIMSGIGVRVVDLLALAMTRRWRLRFFEAKLLIEGAFLAAALITGGPVGLATVAFVSIVGPFVEPFVLVNRRVLRLPCPGAPELAGLS